MEYSNGKGGFETVEGVTNSGENLYSGDLGSSSAPLENEIDESANNYLTEDTPDSFLKDAEMAQNLMEVSREGSIEDSEDNDSEQSRSTSGINIMPSPSCKSGATADNALTSESDSEGESEASSGSRSLEPTPPKRRRANANGIRALKLNTERKRTKEPFLQACACTTLHKKRTTTNDTFGKGKKSKKKIALGMCIDCKETRKDQIRDRRSVKNRPICRFYLFRKLHYSNSNVKKVFGFANSETDYNDEDLRLWLPKDAPPRMNHDMAVFLLREVGDQFCDLVKQERETLKYLDEQDSKEIIWRRVVENLRELCDVCSTTLFNYHWTCGKCGFVVCISCFKARKQRSQIPRASASYSAEKDEFGWLKCHRHIGDHELRKLRLTQIIAGNALEILWRESHSTRRKLKISQTCGCNVTSDLDFDMGFALTTPKNSNTNCESNMNEPDSFSSKLLRSEEIRDVESHDDDTVRPIMLDTNGCSSSSITDGHPDRNGAVENASHSEFKEPELHNEAETVSEEDEDDDIFGLLNDSTDCCPDDQNNDNMNQDANGLYEINSKNSGSTGKHSQAHIENNITNCDIDRDTTLKTFVMNCKGGGKSYIIKSLPKKMNTLAETTRKYPNVPHDWHCSGYLLRLLDPVNPGNLDLFQEQWKRGQPVMVSNVAKSLTQELWTPESFSADFGHKTNPLINCMTGKVVQSQKIKAFWDGFENIKKRLVDENGVPMLLKLKDWPPGEDFAEICKERFEDLMKALPLEGYTHRNGDLNLAARLPNIFSRPDLGPKMYIAYGSGLHLDKGTTNLHLDVSDAANVMVYVGEVKDADLTEHQKAVENAISDSDCDIGIINRVLKDKELPGALWHIWEAKDADKIRNLLNEVNLKEKCVKGDSHHDPIHDQTWYLDHSLRQRLRREYNVIGYPIVQCAGDAVFIPAGAPHQVRNLNNCIKIAEDFVSPENAVHCFHLTEQFRNLTETHTNHEDKLQIKNIVYHTVKDAIAVINKTFDSNQN